MLMTRKMRARCRLYTPRMEIRLQTTLLELEPPNKELLVLQQISPDSRLTETAKVVLLRTFLQVEVGPLTWVLG